MTIRPLTKIERIARACYEVNRAYSKALGDESFLPWEAAPDWQRQTVLNGVHSHLNAVAELTPRQSHELWFHEKTKEGWKYGPVKDPVKKEHPCYVLYDQLPTEQKAKDYLFGAVVNIMRDEIPEPVMVEPLPLPVSLGTM